MARWGVAPPLLLALACGSRDTLELFGEDPPSLPVRGTCLDGFVAPPLEPARLGEQCEAESSLSRAGAAVFAEFTLLGLRGKNGTPWFEFLSEYSRDEYYASQATVVTRGAYVAAAVFAEPRSADYGAFEIALFHVDGTLLHAHRIEAIEWYGFNAHIVITGNDRGIFAYQAGTEPGMEVVTVRGDRLGLLPGYRPESDPDEHGRLAIRDEAAYPEFTRFWLEPCSGEKTPLRSNEGSIDAIGSELLYSPYWAVTETGGIFIETPDGYRFSQPFEHPTHVFEIHPSGWTLFGLGEPARFLSFHPATETLREIVIRLPPGFRRYRMPNDAGFDSSARELHITSSGSIILPLRNDVAGYLFESHDGTVWHKYGRAIGEAYRGFVAESGGTYLHVASDFSADLPTWGEAPRSFGRIDGTSVQLIRPDFLAEWLLHERSVLHQMSSDGWCVASLLGDKTRVANVSDGEVEEYEWRHTDDASFTWIPGNDLYVRAP